jgi:hypothetical protein
MQMTDSRITCPCGSGVEPATPPTGIGLAIEFACKCGRRLDLQATERGWALVGELTPEGSVPVAGFSRELRSAPDVERYWFEARDALFRRTHVHIVYSPSLHLAEVKHSDAKPLRLTEVASPTAARRAWQAAFNRRRRPSRSGRVFEELGVSP